MWSRYNILWMIVRHYRAYRHFLSRDEAAREQSASPQKLVADILRLGPTYIKLGQILSTRPDVLPAAYIQALEQLQERVPEFSFAQAQALIEGELQNTLASLFRSFDERPIAAASLAQVHFAVLPTGVEVAVKVQRPGIAEKMRHDLQMLERLLTLFRRLFPKKVRRANLVNGFKEFKRYTLQELDFAHERSTINRFRENFKDWEDIVFPEVYGSYTTGKLLTMERVTGLRLNQAIKSFSAEQKEKLNTRLAEMELKMFISDGLFHADLHPGNIFFREDGKIALLDFGMYGELTTKERNRFVLYWLAVVQNDVPQAFYHFKTQCRELPGADETAFYGVFQKLAEDFQKSRLQDVSITKVYLNMISAGYRYGYVFPENLLLHAKALTTAEALTFKLAPDARFEKITEPIIMREFVKLGISGPTLLNRLQKSLPAFLLTGEWVPSTDTQESTGRRKTDSVGPLMQELLITLKHWQASAGLFRSLLNPPARKVLGQHGFTNLQVNAILQHTWQEYTKMEPGLPRQQSLGATFTLHLGGATIAMYRALLQAGLSQAEATQLIYRTGWKIYARMGEYPMLIAGMFSDNPHKKMQLATQVFRNFPFSPPDYGWEDVEAGKNTVAFNCTGCQVAELFKLEGLAELCYNTWCKLDFPLAEQWGGHLERSGSIAGGADVCDFRWKVNPEKSEV